MRHTVSNALALASTLLLLACSDSTTPTNQTTVDAGQIETAESAPPSPALPVTENTNHAELLRSADPALAKNKQLVYDMWRTLLEARDVEAAKPYLAPDYIQHNPIADTGRKAILQFVASLGPAQPIQEKVQAKLIAIVAEGDLVAFVQVDEQTQPKPYTSTWFDLFRIDNGQIVEHWDHGTLLPGMPTPQAYVPPTPAKNQAALLHSSNPQLADNKQRVYDMWRTLLVGQQVDQAPGYLAEDYKQHNPMANTGLKGFMDFFQQFAKPTTIPDNIPNLVSIIAENDLVVLATLTQYNDANQKPYATTWFDMFRVENGKMTEHWDTARLPVE